jgi:SPP1 gp7 family putative phage head morphogenesis protein
MRAKTLSRTEIIRSHAEGQLDGLEKLGVAQVGVDVEWSTAGDNHVCPMCKPLDGIVLTLQEARGMIPRHPNCRCSFKPAGFIDRRGIQIREKSKVDAAIEKSLQLGRKLTKGKLARSGKLSKWVSSKGYFS